jgi:hypothetical protein
MSKSRLRGGRDSAAAEYEAPPALELFEQEFKSMGDCGTIVRDIILAQTWEMINEKRIRKKVKPFCTRSILKQAGMQLDVSTLVFF